MPVMLLWSLSSSEYREAMLSPWVQQTDMNRMPSQSCPNQEEIIMLSEKEIKNQQGKKCQKHD